jgi:IS605 OrfB family transposase
MSLTTAGGLIPASIALRQIASHSLFDIVMQGRVIGSLSSPFGGRPASKIPFFIGYSARKPGPSGPGGSARLSWLTPLPQVYIYSYMSTTTLTLCLPIQTDQMPSLRATAVEYRDSFNRVCVEGWKMDRLNGVELHKLTYARERASTSLPSQLVCSARVKATEAVKGAKARAKKGRKASCPEGKSPTIRYDARSATINLATGTASLATIHGRVHTTLTIPAFHQPKTGWNVCSSDLVFHHGGRASLHVAVESEDPVIAPTTEVLGIDLGVNRPAVTSAAEFYGEKRWKDIERKNFNLRRVLQAKGTKSAKRHLKRLRGKVNRFRTDCDHVLSRRIVDSVKPGATIVLEDLTDIRERVKARSKERRRIHAWSFDRLKSFLAYKSKMVGCYVEFVDPRYTSQKCSRCGHTAKANRKTQSWFLCLKCGFQHNADLNAAKNIRSNYLASRGMSVAGGPQSIGLS